MRRLPLVLVLLASHSFAETDYDRWLKQTRAEYSQYREASDREFNDYLKANWEAIGMEPPRRLDTTPKPRRLPDLPAANTPDNSAGNTPAVTLAPLPAGQPQTVADPSAIDSRAIEATPIAGAIVTFDFFGHTLNIPCPEGLTLPYRGSPTGQGIAAWWEKMSETAHDGLLTHLQGEARRLQLNDWGTLLLIQHLAASIHRDDSSRALLSWYLAVRAGFDARVAYNQEIYLLLASDQPLYGITFLTVNRRPYYALGYSPEGRYAPPRGRLFTYERQHENGKAALNFSQSQQFSAAGPVSNRQFEFDFKGQSYNIHLQLRPQYAAYLNLYPQLDLTYYIGAGMPTSSARDVLTQLQPMLAGLSEQEAVNLLLRFVQTAFAYQTDEQQFGHENSLFALETLYFPYSDCEDRVILFSWLVKSLLRLDVALVSWPGHVAAAIAFHGNVAGQGWTAAGKRYVIADPTYINANTGLVMPEFANQQPVIQPL